MNIGIKLLIAEDDPNLGTLLKAFFTQRGYAVVLETDGKSAYDAYCEGDIDACILDVMMPVMDGFELAKNIRKIDKKVPILFLTARNLEADKLNGFEIGADDYITKPFSMEELRARLSATIRRAFDEGKPDKNVFHIGNFVFDYTHLTLTIGDDVKKLTTKEADLLRLFAQNFNHVVERNTTLLKIWKNDSYWTARSMDVYITKLRKYLKADPTVQIQNVHSVGFKLTVVQE